LTKVRLDGADWHSDIARVRHSLQGSDYLVKYGRREHIDSLVHSGSLQISNARRYAAEKSPDRRDHETIRVYETNRHDHQQETEIPAPGSNVVDGAKIRVRAIATEAVHSYPDHWMYSTSMSLSMDLMQRFGRSCCVIVGRSFWIPFSAQVAIELANKKFRALFPDGTSEDIGHLPLKMCHVRDVTYHRTPDDLDPQSSAWGSWMTYIGDTDHLADIFKKDACYAHQHEVKFAWTHFDDDDVALTHRRWGFKVVDVVSGQVHSLIEAREDEDEFAWMHHMELPRVMVKVAPPLRVIKLTLD